jgi:branched-chain amino acid transport system permease protein
MIPTLVYGLTIGGILYLVSIGLSLTFGIAKVLNFAHAAVYALGIYIFVTIMPLVGNMYPVALLGAMIAILPLAYVVERFVIRRLYGESVDYTIIATYAVLLLVVNFIKRVWGTAPIPVNDHHLCVSGLDLRTRRAALHRHESVLHPQHRGQDRVGVAGGQ